MTFAHLYKLLNSRAGLMVITILGAATIAGVVGWSGATVRIPWLFEVSPATMNEAIATGTLEVPVAVVVPVVPEPPPAAEDANLDVAPMDADTDAAPFPIEP